MLPSPFMPWLLLILFAGQFETTFRAGLVALNQNNLPLAESQLEAASRIEPGNALVWLALAQTFLRLQHTDLAQQAAEKAESLAPGDKTVLHSLTLYYSEAGNYSKAVEMGQKALAADAFNEKSYFDLAQLYLKAQNFSAALEVLDLGRQKFDKSAQIELAAGVAYYGLRRFSEAIDAFLRTIDLDPGVEQPYVFLGRMLDQAEGKLPRIEAVFRAFAERAPDNYLGNFLYGKSLRLTEDSKQAERYLRKSIAQNEAFWESHFELGVLLDECNEFREAAQEMKRAVELNPNDPVPHYRLARLYDRLGQADEARQQREIHARLSAAAATGVK